jgi:hypothetical protein
MFELFPELLVFAFLSLSAFFGCERGRIGKSSRSAGRYHMREKSMLVLLTLMKLSFETVNSFFGLVDNIFLKGTVDDATQMMSGEAILIRAGLTKVDWSGTSRTTWLYRTIKPHGISIT